MPKKKKQKEEKKPDRSYELELQGIFLILLAILGFGPFGPVGRFICCFAAFLVGNWYNALLLAVIIIGSYMIIKRKKPEFLTSKLVGLYIIILGILVFSHISYVERNDLQGFAIIKETIDNFLASTKQIPNIQGGGILGSIFVTIFVSLFELKGTKIVTWALIICGALMFTGMSLYEFFTNTKNKVKNIKILPSKPLFTKKEKPVKEEEEENKEEVVVSSEDVLVVDDSLSKIEEEIELIETIELDDTVMPAKKPYALPSIQLLKHPPKNNSKENEKPIQENGAILQQVFADFGISGHIVTAHIGPAVTQYEMEVKAGTKVSKILGIHREIALALAAKDVRIEAPIPGKKTIGIEIPNRTISMVSVREILEQIPSSKKDSKLLVTLGKDIMGNCIFCEINKTPHLLVAGSTGSGKSVCINSIIVSILMRTTPDEVKLVLVDPKKVELSMYNGVPHLLAPVVTDPKKANTALKKIVVEMENRYELFSASGTKNIAGYNEYVKEENKHRTCDNQIRPLPFIVVIIDELADLMLVAAKEVEDSILRITQMARAAGIHLIVATQRPSTDVITGVVKANIPSRIAFAVASGIDSRTILDQTGAEKLLGKGDMLFAPSGENTPQRVQGTFISDEEIKAVVDYTISQQIAHYDETLLMDEEEMSATTMVDSNDDYEEPLYNEIVEFIIDQQKASASFLQRRFHLGYNRAARCIDLLEERGIIGPSNGSKPREVLIKKEEKNDAEK